MRVEIRLLMLTTVSVLLIAFFFGLRTGFKSEAQAGTIRSKRVKTTRLIVPSSAELFPIGSTESEINGDPSESGMLSSPLGVKEVAAEVVSLWEKRGFLAYGVALSDRAAAFATDERSGWRYSMTLWSRETGGTSGLLGAIRSGVGSGSGKAIPGVNFPPGAELGAVFHSNDDGVESWVGSATWKGSMQSARKWFANELRHWRPEAQSESLQEYMKEGRKLSLLFAPGEQGKVIVTAILAEVL